MPKLRLSAAVRAAFAVVPLLALVPACNAITGADGLTVDPSLDVQPFNAVKGVTLREVSLYQGVKRPLMVNGAPADPNGLVPVIAKKDAFVRLFVDLGGDYDGGDVTARLYVKGPSGEKKFETTQKLTASSNDQDLSTTLNISVTDGAIEPEFEYRVEIGRSGREQSGSSFKYPASGAEKVGATSVGQTLRIKLVPVKYNADNSGRLPDTSEEQLTLYRNYFHAMYPVPEIDLTVRDPLPWNQSIDAFGGGWGEILDRVGMLRQSDNPPFDVYYFGIFNPENSFGQFCGQGCVLGLAFGATSPMNTYNRVAVGIGYTGTDSVETALHEIGHTHGREHAPCGGAGGPDPNFPHPGGKDGVWGYDLHRQQLFSPDTPDIMGYCLPVWISDYTYDALHKWIKTVNDNTMMRVAEGPSVVYDRALVRADGTLALLPSLALTSPPIAQKRAVTLEVGGLAVRMVDAHYMPFDHLDGGVLFWPSVAEPWDSVSVHHHMKVLRASK